MSILSPLYVHMFPLIPGGGLFFVPVGMCIILGAFFPRLRMALVWIGMAAGVLAVMSGNMFYRGLPPPTALQIAAFAVAIAAEVAAFRFFIPRLRGAGDRRIVVVTLAIVGAHFLLMIPAFGWPILLLALLCLTNALVAYKSPIYPISGAWFVDGSFKVAVGLLMFMASPVFAAAALSG